MKYSSVSISLLLLIVLSVALILSGIVKRPGIGIIVATIVIPVVMWIRGNTLTQIGLSFPESWGSVILQGLGYGLVISVLSFVLIDPLSEVITKTTIDYGPVSRLKGNWLALTQTLLFVWLFVAVTEETIFRGFLMTEVSKIAGSGAISLTISILFTSVIFGLCHAYQNNSGIVSTGLIGVLLAGIFLATGRNLWVAILTHGFIDTIGICLIYFGYDQYLRQLLPWKAF